MIKKLKKSKKHYLNRFALGCFVMNSAFLLGSAFVSSITAENHSFTEMGRLVTDISIITFSASTVFLVWAQMGYPSSCFRCQSRVSPTEESAATMTPETHALIPLPLAPAAPFVALPIISLEQRVEAFENKTEQADKASP